MLADKLKDICEKAELKNATFQRKQAKEFFEKVVAECTSSAGRGYRQYTTYVDATLKSTYDFVVQLLRKEGLECDLKADTNSYVYGGSGEPHYCYFPYTTSYTLTIKW